MSEGHIDWLNDRALETVPTEPDPGGPDTYPVEERATKTIMFECECGEIYPAEVDARTYHPPGNVYGPCPECGMFTTLHGAVRLTKEEI